MAHHLGLSKNNHKFGMLTLILYFKIKPFSIFFVLSLQTRANPYSPLTSPRRTKRRVRGYLFYTHESSFSLSFFDLILHASDKISLFFILFYCALLVGCSSPNFHTKHVAIISLFYTHITLLHMILFYTV